MFSQSRQINGCEQGRGGRRRHQGHEQLQATRSSRRRASRGGSASEDANPYRQEHEDLIASIRAGKPINEAQAVAESTMTGILGREAAYSGQAIEWDAAMKSTKRLGPEKYEFGPYPIPEVAMPGVYRFS